MGQGLSLAETQAGARVFRGLGGLIQAQTQLNEKALENLSFYVDISKAHQGLGSPFSEGPMYGTFEIQACPRLEPTLNMIHYYCFHYPSIEHYWIPICLLLF